MTDADIDIAFFSAADGPDLVFLGLAVANAIVVVDQSNLGFFLSLT